MNPEQWEKWFKRKRKQWQKELTNTPKDLKLTRVLLEGLIQDPTGDYHQLMFGLNPRTGEKGLPKKLYKDFDKLKHLLEKNES